MFCAVTDCNVYFVFTDYGMMFYALLTDCGVYAVLTDCNVYAVSTDCGDLYCVDRL